MLPAKYQPNRSRGSEKRSRFFTTYEHGGNLKYRIMTILNIVLQSTFNVKVEIWPKLAT